MSVCVCMCVCVYVCMCVCESQAITVGFKKDTILVSYYYVVVQYCSQVCEYSNMYI